MRIAAPLNVEFEPTLQWVELASFFQIPNFHIIGLPAPEVGEARERIRAAIEASGFEFPRRRLVINLSPASVKKRGTGLDLAMALAVLAESRARRGAPDCAPDRTLVAWGELGLDGRVKAAGQITRVVYSAWRQADFLLVPAAEYGEASLRLDWIQKAHPSDRASDRSLLIVPIHDLASARRWMLDPESHGSAFEASEAKGMAEGLEAKTPTPQLLPLPPSLERVLGMASAGKHHLLLLGPRGTGKTHALDWLVALQTPSSLRVRIDNCLLTELQNQEPSFQSAANGAGGSAFTAIVRRVGSQCRPASLLGSVQPGFTWPGEFSLSHGGLLIADELPEWSRDTRELLREPLEQGFVTLTRAKCSVEFPARFTLAATGNLCACGGWPAEIPVPLSIPGQGDAGRPPQCRCRHSVRTSYIGKLSGPILDRIDLLSMVTYGKSRKRKAPERSPEKLEALRDQVLRAQERAVSRWGKPCGHLSGSELEEILREQPRWRELLDEISLMSLRSRHKTLRIALTIAAWDAREELEKAQLFEASCYRPERFGFCD